jgi:metal-responsive CopG/Arc/MetJ family transcriptional regulator
MRSDIKENTSIRHPWHHHHVKTRTRLSVSLSDELIKEIDERRGLAKRSNYIEYLIRKGLKPSSANKNLNS